MAHKHERVSYHKRGRLTLFYLIALLIGVSLSVGIYWKSRETPSNELQAATKLVANLSVSTDIPQKNTSQGGIASTEVAVAPKTAFPTSNKVVEKAKPLKKGAAIRIVISKSKYELSVLAGDQVVKTYNIAVGQNAGDKKKVGDMKTPEGTFKVQNIQDASYWTHDFKDGKGQIAGAYGPKFVRLKTPPWTGIGIHGTHDPNSIGTQATEGCIRLHNDDLLDLLKKIKIGTPVEIRP